MDLGTDMVGFCKYVDLLLFSSSLDKDVMEPSLTWVATNLLRADFSYTIYVTSGLVSQKNNLFIICSKYSGRQSEVYLYVILSCPRTVLSKAGSEGTYS